MFIDFFLMLKNYGLNVSLRSYLTLLESLDKKLAENSVEKFYYLSRAILVKHEQDIDKFDQVFSHFFKGTEMLTESTESSIPEEWLYKNFEKYLSKEEKEVIEAMGGIEKLMERFKELMKEQKKRHEGGNKWIGTGGTSPFGAYGYNPEGYRIGQHKSRHRRALKVWDKREFADLDSDLALETRNMKQVLRQLRKLSREGIADELDLEGTIKKTSEKAGLLELQMIPSKTNRVKVLLLFDIGGSMDEHVKICSRLFSAARHEFSQLEFYYFHNCLYEFVWKKNSRRQSERISTFDLIHKYNSDYKLIFVGDASMSPYEIMTPGASVEHYNEEAGIKWLGRINEHFQNMVWLNPVPEDEWDYTQSINIIRDFTNDRMFPMTISGISKAMQALQDSKKTYSAG